MKIIAKYQEERKVGGKASEGVITKNMIGYWAPRFNRLLTLKTLVEFRMTKQAILSIIENLRLEKRAG